MTIARGLVMTDNTNPRPPWHGLVALAVASGMWAAVWFSTTPRGQRWIEQQLQPFGHAAILAYLLAIVLFFGALFFVLTLTITAAWRREPLRLGEIGVAIYLALYLQVGEQDPTRWGGFLLHLLFAGVLVFAGSWLVRRLVRRVARPS